MIVELLLPGFDFLEQCIYSISIHIHGSFPISKRKGYSIKKKWTFLFRDIRQNLCCQINTFVMATISRIIEKAKTKINDKKIGSHAKRWTATA